MEEEVVEESLDDITNTASEIINAVPEDDVDAAPSLADFDDKELQALNEPLTGDYGESGEFDDNGGGKGNCEELEGIVDKMKDCSDNDNGDKGLSPVLPQIDIGTSSEKGKMKKKGSVKSTVSSKGNDSIGFKPPASLSPGKKSSNSPKKFSNDVTRYEDRMAEIEAQLQAVRAELNTISPKSKKKGKSDKLPKIKKVSKYSEEALHHPNLDLVMAQNAYSPYLIAPDKKYTSKVFLSGYVGELRFMKKDEAKKKLPYDLSKAKKRFVNDILKFKVDYKPAGALRKERKPKRPMSRSHDFIQTTAPPVTETPLDIGNNMLSEVFESDQV